MWYEITKPFLFLLEAEQAHHLTLSSLKMGQQCGLIRQRKPLVNKTVHCFGLEFPNPIGLAAGLDKNAECLTAWSNLGFGFIEVGTVTPKPQIGNPKPRLFRLQKDHALINRMGFNNYGVSYLVERLKAHQRVCPIGVNIGKNKDTPLHLAHEDYVYCFEKVYPFASYVTVNLSSPNTPDLKSLQHGDLLKSVLIPLKEQQKVLAQRYQKTVPILVKISPDLNIEEVQDIVKTLLELRVEGIIATNTTVQRPPQLRSLRKGETGGLSGEPLFEKSNQIVAAIYQMAGDDLPMIAVGGVSKPMDAIQKLKLGAKLVQIYTGLIYQGPKLVRDIVKAL